MGMFRRYAKFDEDRSDLFYNHGIHTITGETLDDAGYTRKKSKHLKIFIYELDNQRWYQIPGKDIYWHGNRENRYDGHNKKNAE